MTHAEYCKNKSMRINTPFCVESDGTAYWIVNGKKITPERFNAIYPISGSLQTLWDKKYAKGENPDKRNLWQK